MAHQSLESTAQAARGNSQPYIFLIGEKESWKLAECLFLFPIKWRSRHLRGLPRAGWAEAEANVSGRQKRYRWCIQACCCVCELWLDQPWVTQSLLCSYREAKQRAVRVLSSTLPSRPWEGCMYTWYPSCLCYQWKSLQPQTLSLENSCKAGKGMK